VRLPLLLAASLLSASAAEPAAGWKRHVIDNSSRGADGTRLADINGDGLPDIVTGWEQGGVVRAYQHPGPARVREPWPAVTVGKAGDVEDAVFADLDGDGATDVVSASEGKTKSLFLHWSPTDKAKRLDPAAWTTAPLPGSTGRMMWMFTLPLQVDGRHGFDLVAGGKGADAAIGWWQSPANARDLAAWRWHSLRPVGWLMSLVAADMDGDGDLDVLFTDRKGGQSVCAWLENPGANADLTQPWKEHPVGGAGREVMFLKLADLDGDGLQDVLVATKPREILFLRRTARDGRSWQAHAIRYPEHTGTAKAVTVGDVDGDGKPDLVVTCEQAAAGKWGVFRLSFRKSPTDAEWDIHPISGADGVKHDLVELLDLDGDGDLDVLTCEEAKNLGVIWYENPLRQPGR